jgi:phosphatidylserine decarboxylase
MFRIHREGVTTLALLLFIFIAVYWLLYMIVPDWMQWALVIVLAGFYYFFLQFFRNPERKTPVDANAIIAPADGKVVVIEETEETEYFHDKRMQISIFMSPLNVHLNRSPVNGKVKYMQYHPGKYLVAWHPKSSTENERNTVVIGNEKADILIRQIAGKVARRIVCYVQKEEMVETGNELGFIKFGSRVDIFLPLSAKINVKLEQAVIGGETIIGYF